MLSDIKIDGQAAAQLAAADWPCLKTIALNVEWWNPDVNLGSEGAAALAKAHWPDLEHFNINSNQIGNAGMELLSKGAIWPRLKVLDLASTGVTAAGAAALALSAAQWPKLTDLTLNRISAAGAAALATASWPALSTLQLSKCI